MKHSNNGKRTRDLKAGEGYGKVTKNKFQEAREEEINAKPIRPMNAKQKLYKEMIEDFSIPTVLATGYAGTSKTWMPTAIACDWLRTGKISRLIFTRPNISNSKSLGFFTGSSVEKLSQWLMPVIDILRERLGANNLDLLIKKGDIVFLPLEVVKGYSANNCVFICDEAEDLSIDEAKKLVTRLGQNAKMILAGDISQSELKDASGLKFLITMAAKHENLSLGTVDFNEISDIVRSEAVKNWIIAFEQEGKANGR
jgi:phosphate starvation-inducible PhoH-like protein